MSRHFLGLALFGIGYAMLYWATNILVSAYLNKGSTPMNPVPLGMAIGV